jgi:XisH protein
LGVTLPAIDQCEYHVIQALKKAGWLVIDQPFPIRISREEGVFANLRLRKISDTTGIIVIEVKCFSEKRSTLDEFYHAVGQYLLYRNALILKNIDVPLYLSVPVNVYDTFFQRTMVQAVIEDAKIRIVVIDIERETVVKWLN